MMRKLALIGATVAPWSFQLPQFRSSGRQTAICPCLRTRRPQKLEDLPRQEASLVSHGEPTDERCGGARQV
jgi:hypothetical protein